MTGVADVWRNARTTWKALRGRVDKHSLLPEIPSPFVLDFRKTVWSVDHNSATAGGCSKGDDVSEGFLKSFRWALLLPICFHGGGTEDECWERLQGFLNSVAETTSADDRALFDIYIALDRDDELFDTEEGKARLGSLFGDALGHEPNIYVKTAGWRHNICWMWDFLATKAVANGSDFFVLMGDDVRLTGPGWKEEIEKEFLDISKTRNLPFGMGLVAFRDESFLVSPTFPVLHKLHFEVFGSILPSVFENQEADPFLFQVYRRFGACRFAGTATLQNLIGGLGVARYRKKTEVSWKGELLDDSIKAIERFLQLKMTDSPTQRYRQQPVCLDVVIPTFRCDKAHLNGMLESLCRHGAPDCLSVSILVVVDNPSIFLTTEEKESFQRELSCWETGAWVRVWIQESNCGASSARNAGLRQSAGDYMVFLDDDTDPDPNLLQAYAALCGFSDDTLLWGCKGAIAREPNTSVLVGRTSLPAPETLLQHAVLAADLDFFYRVASELPHPPWGVTANLCVKNPERTGGGVYFDMRYPKTGGGEDVSFCLTLKDLHAYGPRRQHPAAIAVPEATVQHPFWANITAQVLGWASGDVRCLEAMPSRTFYAPPNWAEWCLMWSLGFALALWPGSCNTGERIISPSVMVALPCGLIAFPVTAILMRAPPIWANLQRQLSRTGNKPPMMRPVLVLLAAALPMAQEIMRLASKLRTGRLYQIMLHFDWMDGLEDHKAVARFSLLVGSLMSLLMLHAMWVVWCIALLNIPTATWLASFAAAEVAVWFILYHTWWVSHLGANAPLQQQLQTHNAAAPLPLTLQTTANEDDGAGILTTPFVVLGHQRTGTNLLCGRLFHCKPDIVMHNEMFDARHIWTYYREQLWGDDRWTWKTTNARNADPYGFLDAVFSLTPAIVQDLPATATGHKLLPHMWNGNPSLKDVFKRMIYDQRIRKVVLRRESHLEVYVSLACAKMTGEWLGTNTDHIQVYIPPDKYMEFLKEYEAWYSYYNDATAGQEVCSITFEELICPSDQGMKKVLSFLGIPADRPMPAADCTTVKQSRKKALDKVANLDELHRAFRFTRWGGDMMP